MSIVFIDVNTDLYMVENAVSTIESHPVNDNVYIQVNDNVYKIFIIVKRGWLVQIFVSTKIKK